MRKPESCTKCGAEAQERRRCPRCGEAEWVLQHGAHYMQGAREVIGCPCPAFHTALGRRKQASTKRQSARVEAVKRTNHPVSTPEMARKAAEGIVQGLRPSQALREAGYPPSTSSNGKLNKMIRGELRKMGKMGMRYQKMGET